MLRILCSLGLLISIPYHCYLQPVISINNDKGKVDIGNRTAFFNDTSDAIPYQQILSGVYDEKFKVQSQKKSGSPGILRFSVWGRFSIKNQSDQKLILVVDNAHTADLYTIKRGELIHRSSSIYQPFHSRELRSNKLSFLLDISVDSTQSFYVQMQTNSGIRSPLAVYSMNSWIEREHQVLILDGIYIGVMAIMILYNLFIFLAIKDRSYIFYVLYVTFMTLTNMNVKSISFEFLWPNNPNLNHYINISACLAGIFAIIFAFSFLQLSRHSRILRYILTGILICYGITIIIILMNYQFQGFILTEIISLVAAALLWTAGYIVYKKGYKPALFYLIAWSALLACVIIFLLKDYNVLPFNDFTSNAITIGSALEAMLLSLALADKINIYKKEKAKAQQQALTSLTENRRLVLEQNILLEDKVQERTSRLKAANEELKKAFLNINQTQDQLNKSEREKMEARYQKELFELEAQALRAQMNPHFIYNCMNSIKYLIQNDEKQKSIDYLTSFSKLIRTLFNNADNRQVSLYDELETCRLYTQLEAMRLDGKLQYQFHINQDLDLKSVMVPALIIQPFIENAIWHGIVPKGKGRVSVDINGDEENIFCEIDDDGIGREVSKKNKPLTPVVHHSKAINLLQARLNLEKILSDRKANVEILDKYENEQAIGTKVLISFEVQ